ncbi:hypothetical protein [Dyadobacter sp. LHD-138]|uniref:hypothetical protein n=1 Tax=Dyadobacter sp. LHD-138 TaxID=3071413 RepID=UPI0027DFF968|nr:hypothetical protein [Dyadobacter sp. LHD-138]MDQ6478136.1 hypothetical protein [Dyadobacter sp. LHD-138]
MIDKVSLIKTEYQKISCFFGILGLYAMILYKSIPTPYEAPMEPDNMTWQSNSDKQEAVNAAGKPPNHKSITSPKANLMPVGHSGLKKNKAQENPDFPQ